MTTDFQERLADIRQRIEAACRRAGRDAAGVNLLAVTKTLGPEAVAEATGAGLACFGESRVQEARQKIPQCPSNLHWHFIGHLQTNKVREALRWFEVIHAVDSVRLLEAIDRGAQEEGRTVPVCLEVNVSGERSKFGLNPDDVPAVLARASSLFRVRIMGLMTIPPIAADPAEARPFFQRLRTLRDRWQAETGVPLPELSMGMSHDFEVAVEEGATWIRLGTLLFGPRKKREIRELEGP
jgi:pyridoxal phosphate enzyme (YggS family)